MFEVKLESLDNLHGWANNPRVCDPERFYWIQLSLMKFGFVTPVYARADDGLIYSGHQRTNAAKALGFDKVPVCRLPPISDNRFYERAVNINFNLCTNDHLSRSDFGLKAKQGIAEIVESVQKIPDAINPYPVMSHFNISPADFLNQITEKKKFQPGLAGVADFFTKMGVDIPIVLDKDDNILNGINRIASAIHCGRISYPAVRIQENADMLMVLLNKITMSFDLQKAFGEELRYNSFFYRINQASQRQILGVGFYHWVFGKEARKGGKAWLENTMTLLEGEYRARWIAEHGTTVIDFGAGRLDNCEKLQASGIECIPFEPYILRPKTDIIHFQSARIIARRFLQWVAQRSRLDSLFCSSVFNSVPFKLDRDYLMIIFQALCLHGARLYLTTLHESGIKQRLFSESVNATQRVDDAILLDSEPGLLIGSLSDTPKIQKYHSESELKSLGSRFFSKVVYVAANSSSHGIKCEGSKPMDWEKLVLALEFEFNLPYPGERRMNLQDEALKAFSVYCNHDLERVRAEMQQEGKYETANREV